MKSSFLLSLILSTSSALAVENLVVPEMVSEVVYVESPTDTDGDGNPDRIYVSVNRPNSDTKISTIFEISPYAMGGNDGPMHNVDSELLPQDSAFNKIKNSFGLTTKTLKNYERMNLTEASTYARVSAHSVGTGKSTGCATVGDINETLAAKAVIDWLNGRARAFDSKGALVTADWANGNVGMTGTSYDGTLPIMVATTGVEGLKAIIPVAAISNWYNYYRANGLVVNPGGYIGEDADVLGFFIMRRGSCKSELARITQDQGRAHGDYTDFWQNRDYVPQIKNIKAATFIIHGQNDWNVKQTHAIELWENLQGVAPRRMFLHKGGHGSTYNHGVPGKVQAWFDYYVDGQGSRAGNGSPVEVELTDGTLMSQNEWPHEQTKSERFFFAENSTLGSKAPAQEVLSFIDSGRSQKMDSLIANPETKSNSRVVFLNAPFKTTTILSGTSSVTLSLAVMNRKAANITVALVEYDARGKGKIITRGWADPQNYRDISRGEKLVPGKVYNLTFPIEPKQTKIAAGNRLGVVIASTDYEYTLRPKEGTQIQVSLGANSFIDLKLSNR